ncbi:hypothetical protein ACXNSR_00580 [Streptomyces sp. NC-S4]
MALDPWDELPQPAEKMIDDALLTRLGGNVHESTRLTSAPCAVEAAAREHGATLGSLHPGGSPAPSRLEGPTG